MKQSRPRPRQRVFCLLNNFIINPLYLFVKNNLLILIDLLGKSLVGKPFLLYYLDIFILNENDFIMLNYIFNVFEAEEALNLLKHHIFLNLA